MCGLAGFIDFANRRSEAELRAVAQRMASTLRHRGPDDEGVWVDAEAGIALGHTRLSVIDLSAAGAQPMISADGRLVISYNGEVYNHSELRAELVACGHVFRGRSDTEVIVEACAAWGVERTAERLIGMFAFALWDRRTRTLKLVRDRLGIKPLYWGLVRNTLLFASELKALRAHPGWSPRIDRHALVEYLRYHYVPAPYSIYEGVFKLAPGRIVTIRENGPPQISCFWDACSVARNGLHNPVDENDAAAVDALNTLLLDAVRRRMIADVPLGAFLSGGIDSSTVVALMQAQSNRPIRTFSIGFRESDFDEARHARAVASHLGTDHTEIYVEPSHSLAVIPCLSEWFDEPLADSSQIPTYLVSELGRRSVTAVLTGDGGDELFSGYDHYVRVAQLWAFLGRIPRPLRRGIARLLGPAQRLPLPAIDRLLAMAPAPFSVRRAGDRLHRFIDILPVDDTDELHRFMISAWHNAEGLLVGPTVHKGQPGGIYPPPDIVDPIDRMQLQDQLTYLPDDILTKVDRTSMAVSLEARVPLLDHRVIEFVWQLPRRMKLRDGQRKWILRQVLYRYVPRVLVERPKKGFDTPIGAWLRGPLREWAETLIDERRLLEDGLLDPRPIRKSWREHLRGERNWETSLWAVLMFQSWKARWM
jgi:asparagine synthase (glutamine-hydrolysing)